MGKKAGGAAMIKISRVAVFDPQYAAIVSARPHEEPNAAVAREETQYTNFLTLLKRWRALANSLLFFLFLKDRKATTCFNSEPPPAPEIIHTLAIHWPVTFLKNTLKRRGNTSMWGQTQKVVTLFNGAALRLVNVMLSGGGDGVSEGMCS